uniref:Uncharacterized protein n=1 Tax=Cyclopterus lumpus TaxID=8103 RepID=A0A8C2Z0H9_CYCLU
MIISIPSILLGLGGKCLLNWALVILQRDNICKSLLGVFSVSLAVVDTILTLFVTTLHMHDDGCVFFLGLKLTRYRVCLLVQILGQVYNALQWLHSITARTRFIVCLFVTGLLWYLTVLYVFFPVMEDVSHDEIYQCWTFHTTQILQVAMFLLLSLGCAVLHAGGVHSRRDAVHQAIRIFLNTRAPFQCFLAVLLLAPVGIPAYLGLNTAWLCFLNSLLIAVVLCAVSARFYKWHFVSISQCTTLAQNKRPQQLLDKTR